MNMKPVRTRQQSKPSSVQTISSYRTRVATLNLPPARNPLSLSSSNSNNSEDNGPNDQSSSTDPSRLSLIRHIQRSFYQNSPPGVGAPNRGSTTIAELPLWRVQWTELPGYQNVLHVHVPHYTDMFLRILNGGEGGEDERARYFGHLYLPGGSENLDNDEYRLDDDDDGDGGESMACRVGVLMRISDYKQLDDGRLMLVVQALERFRVVSAHQGSAPYPTATVEIMPDRELVELKEHDDGDSDAEDEDEGMGTGDSDDDASGALLPLAVNEAFSWHPFEARPVRIDECMVTAVADGMDSTVEQNDAPAIDISPLINFDANGLRHLKDDDTNNTNNTNNTNAKSTSLYTQTSVQRVIDLEYAVWIQLDQLIRLLNQLIGNMNTLPQKVTSIPIPTQILGLLPQNPPRPWPSNFALEQYATQMTEDATLVGTGSKSPFVRVDDGGISYPPLRRAQRFSYVVWILMDSSSFNFGTQTHDKQSILEMETLAERLKAALARLEDIGSVLRLVLDGAD